MGEQIKNIGKNTNDENLKTRSYNVICSADLLQAVAGDMKYHLSCLVRANSDRVINEKTEKKLAGSYQTLKLLKLYRTSSVTCIQMS